MKKIGLFMGVLLLLIILAGTAGCMGIFDDFSLAASTDEILQWQTQTQTQTQTPTQTPTQTATQTPTQTPTQTLTQTPMQTLTQTPTPTPTPTPEWIQWSTVGIDLGKGGYSMIWPNYNDAMLKDMKLEIDMDDNTRMDLHIFNEEEAHEYQNSWGTSTSFDWDAIGIFIGGVSQLTEEYHSDEGMALILEPTDDQPGTGTIKIYYLK